MSFKKVTLCVQARLDSKRLPQKTLLPIINNKTLLECVLENLHGVADTNLLLTTSDAKASFENIAKKTGFEIKVGSKDNVLERFVVGLAGVNADYVIRATADNALIGKKLPKSLVEIAIKNDVDYARYLNTPYGGGVEVFKKSAVEIAYKEATTSYEKEHVTPYIYNNPQKFKLLLVEADEIWQGENLRATIDTNEDYEYIKKVYSSLYKDKPIELEDFINWAK